MPTMNNLKSTSSAASRSTRFARLAAVAALLGGAAVGALAQYKIVGPDGKVTYTDKPPTAADIRAGGNSAPATSSSGGIPYETRQAMSRYPVTLYASKSCAPCDSARSWLRQHAVPFNEYSLSTNADFLAAQQRFGDNTVPVTTIGSQTLKGYSPNDLQSYIDAAGYPRQGRLTGYSWPAAMPLAPRSAPTPAPVAATAAPSAPASLLPPPSESGIQF
jgi:glutaredoxin